MMSTLSFTIVLLGSYGAGCAIAGALYFLWGLDIKIIAIGGIIAWGISGIVLVFLRDREKHPEKESKG